MEAASDGGGERERRWATEEVGDKRWDADRDVWYVKSGSG